MRHLSIIIFTTLTATVIGCAGTTRQIPAPQTTPPSFAPPSPLPNANFELSVHEIAENLDQDTSAYVQIYINSEAAGQTQIGPKSQEKKWWAELPQGNQLMRFEVWDSTGEVSGVRRADDFQPRERFVQIKPQMKTKVIIKIYDKGKKYDYRILREP